jgi:beta-lactam-binding protein with PASTA domain
MGDIKSYKEFYLGNVKGKPIEEAIEHLESAALNIQFKERMSSSDFDRVEAINSAIKELKRKEGK